MMGFSVRRLTGEYAGRFRSLALRDHPDFFAVSLDVETATPVDAFADRLQRNIVYGAAAPDGALAGVVGFYAEPAEKLRHKAIVWGMYVRPEARGAGVGMALMLHLIGDARGQVEELRLAVGAENAAAGYLYERVGFRDYGIEPRALKVGDRYVDERLMALRLAGSRPAGG